MFYESQQKFRQMNKILVFLFFTMHTGILFGQKDSLKNLSVSAYGEFYYSRDFSDSKSTEKPNFIYNHKKLNQLSANLLLVRAKYDNKTLRANLGLMAGDYAKYNLSSEPELSRYLYDANIGIRLSDKNNIWLDAGIFPSHIGFESAISADCWTLTRSILAENSPYYESGIKMSYTSDSEKLNLAFLILNGWQKIRRPDLIQNPSFGLQLNYRISNKLLFNYSNFTGRERLNDIKSIRSFHNLYLQYDLGTKAGLIAGFDFGTDKFNPDEHGIWLSPVLIVRYEIVKNLSMAARAELYQDKKQIIIPTNTAGGFNVSGFSGNINYQINEKIQFRVEGKLYSSPDRIFDNNLNRNYNMTTSLSFKI